MYEKGKTLAEERLNIPDDTEKRDAMLSGAGKGALAAGAMAVLLGTSAGRKLTGASLKLGSLAAIGGVAYKAYQDWQSKSGQTSIAADKPITELSDNDLDNRSKQLLRAMIAAAKIDGHIDDKEKAILLEQVSKMNLHNDASAFIAEELKKDVNVTEIASGVDSGTAAAEIYLLSRLVINVDDDKERQYLSQLASALALSPDLVASLDKQTSA
ncbi:MAG: tellurite resistance TerB family protein [Methyloglobulus sp.]